MQLPDFTVEHLKRLPFRANVAFAARCARRVVHLVQARSVVVLVRRTAVA